MLLIPLVLIGGLFAFLVGRRLFSRSAKEPASAPPVATLQEMPPRVEYSEPLPAQPRRSRSYISSEVPSLASRKEAIAVELLAAEDSQIALEERLRLQDEEEARRERLLKEARERSRSKNVLVGKLDVPVSAGPLTQHIALTKDLLKQLEAAAASRDAAPKV